MNTLQISEVAEVATRDEVPMVSNMDKMVNDELTEHICAQKNSMGQVAESDRELQDPVFLVERLLQKKIIRKRMYYLVKWVGFEEPTWEPHDNIPSTIKRNFNKDMKASS